MTPVNPHDVKAANRFTQEARGFATKQLIIIVSFTLVAIAAIGVAVYFYMQYQKTQEQLKNPTSQAEQASNALIAAVGKLIELPQGEQPTIATVSDVNKLKGQAFFAEAKNGDKVLIYTKAQKAILYDPTQNKIVEVGPINLSQTAQSPTSSASATPSTKPGTKVTPTPTPASVKVTLYNGTTIVGYTTTVANQLATSMPNVTVASRQNAAKSTYIKTVVVDLTGKQKTAAAQLAKTLGGQVGSLPAGETKPVGSDLLVILGK